MSHHTQDKSNLHNQTTHHFGGHGTPIHIALANGFPPQTYQPLLNPLTAQYQVLSFPPRPLWENPPSPQTLATWEGMADDLLAALSDHNLTHVIGIGHSMGAVATMIAAVKEPERFKAIVLLDPTVFPPRMLWMLKTMRLMGLDGRFPLVKKALKRRNHFTDENEAFAYWRSKRLFKDWSDEVLQYYVQGLTQPSPNGTGGIQLAWSPEWEARYYATIYTNSWNIITQLKDKLPILTIRGTTSNTFSEPAADLIRKRLPNMTYTEIEGHGHLFPQSAPDATRAIITEWLETI